MKEKRRKQLWMLHISHNDLLLGAPNLVNKS